jgi:hydroxymethylpyrimidine/phosphomethylpyrimidine kinase
METRSQGRRGILGRRGRHEGEEGVRVPTALAVGGIDTGNGAGVESDVRAMGVVGVHGVLAPTAITVQTTLGISRIVPIDPGVLKETLEKLHEDFEFKVAKTGMIWRGQARIVSEFVKSRDVIAVVDPVLRAKDGTALIPDLEEFKELMRVANTVTPNVPEAEALSGIKIVSLRDQVEACETISKRYGVPNVIVKGGHLSGYDVGCFQGERVIIKGVKFPIKDTHGTGSALASFFAAFLARGEDHVTAFERSVALVKDSVKRSLRVGKGIGPINVFATLWVESQKFRVVQEMLKVGSFIESAEGFHELIPEVQMNVAHSVEPELVSGLEDVATFRDRITKTWDNKVKIGYPVVFGKPTHTARLLLSAISKGAEYVFAVNIRFSERTIRALRAYYSDVIEVNRDEEPAEVKGVEGKSMEWVVTKAMQANNNKVPHVIFDRGTRGKEAMIRLLVGDVDELLSVFEHLLRKS